MADHAPFSPGLAQVLLRVAAVGVGLALQPFASGQIVAQWTAPQGGAFDDPGNWAPAPPGSADTCLFGLPGGYAVTVDASPLVDRLIVRDGAVAFELASSLEAGSPTAMAPSIVVGDSPRAAPSLALHFGTLVGQHMEIGSPPGSSGAVSISDVAALHLAKLLLIGPRGTGALATQGSIAAQRVVLGSLVSGHGEASATGPAGHFAVEQLITIGQKGLGLLHLSGGAGVTSDEAIVALDVFSTGALLLEGPGTSAAFASSIDVGRNGVGSLVISDGATVTCGADCILGTIPQSFIFPQFPGGDGTLIVEGAGSTLHVGVDLIVPLGGSGAVELGPGGSITVAGAMLFNRPSAADLSFELDGSSASSSSPFIAVAGTVTSNQSDPVQTTVQIAEGYRPEIGQVFTLIAGAAIESTFEVLAPPLEAPMVWIVAVETEPRGQALRLRVSTIFDLDGSGAVDGADLGLLLAAWGTSGAGDFDGSGSVDGADLGLLLGAWAP